MNRFAYFTDEEIIKGIVSNKDWALNALYKMHFPMVYNLIVNNNGTPQEAKDVYQEAVIVFYNNIRSEEFSLDCKIKTYIYSVSRRLWLNELKIKNKFVNNLNDFEDILEIEKDEESRILENESKFRVLNKSLEELGEPCQTILKDFYLEKISMSVIAEKMGYTNAENAKNQKYKCLQRLKKLFFTNLKKFNKHSQSNAG